MKNLIIFLIFSAILTAFAEEETALSESDISALLPENGYLDKDNKLSNNSDPTYEYLLLLKKVAVEQLIAYRLELKKWAHPYKGLDFTIPAKLREFYPKERFPKLSESFDILDSTVYVLINTNKENRVRLVNHALDESAKLKKIESELMYREHKRKQEIAEKYIKLPDHCNDAVDPLVSAYSMGYSPECEYHLYEGSAHWKVVAETLEWTENNLNIDLLKGEKEVILNSFHILAAEIPASFMEYIFKNKGYYTGKRLYERLGYLALNEKGLKKESEIAEELIDKAIEEALNNNTESLKLLSDMVERDDLLKLYQFESLKIIATVNYKMISEYIGYMEQDLTVEYASWKRWNNIKRGILYGVGGISAIGALIFPRYGYMGIGFVTASLAGTIFIYQGISDYLEVNKDYLLITSFFIGSNTLSDFNSYKEGKIMHTKAVMWLTFDMAMGFLDILWIKQLSKNLTYLGKGYFALSDDGIKLLERTRDTLRVKIGTQSNGLLKKSAEFRLRQIEKALVRSGERVVNAQKSFFDKNLLIMLRRLRQRVGAWNDWVRAKVELQAYSGIYGETTEGGVSAFKAVQEKFAREVAQTPEFLHPAAARESQISMIGVRRILKKFRAFGEGNEIPELFFRVQGRIIEVRELLLTLPKQILQKKSAIAAMESDLVRLREIAKGSRNPSKISFWSLRLQISNKSAALSRYRKEMQGLYEQLDEQYDLYKLYHDQPWLDATSKSYAKVEEADLKVARELLDELKSYGGQASKEIRAIIRDNYFTRNSFLEATYRDAGVAEDLLKNLESGSWLGKRFSGVAQMFRKWFKTRLLNDPKFNAVISEKTSSHIWDIFRFALISGPAIYAEENMFGLFDKLWGLISKDAEEETKMELDEGRVRD